MADDQPPGTPGTTEHDAPPSEDDPVVPTDDRTDGD
jgi:hypothetical protein